jgi:FkbM family methyltransferase
MFRELFQARVLARKARVRRSPSALAATQSTAVDKRTLYATVPLELELPLAREGSLRSVLNGEYDAPFFGTGLTILDIGANIGAFSLWANLRWPQSTIYGFEPHPGTFEILMRNVGHLSNVVCTPSAVYPGDNPTEAFFSRYDGDGEAGIVQAMMTTWQAMPTEQIQQVSVVHPQNLPTADIVKIDVEGSEVEIVEHLNLDSIALLLIEYQNLENRRGVVQAAEQFEIVREVSSPWRKLLDVAPYRPELDGDRYGTIVLAHRRMQLRRAALPDPIGLKELLRQLPSLVKQAIPRWMDT